MITPATFQKKLLQWFDQYGRKQLPWQLNKTPYRVWVSEIMLQQTQVQTVIPYFEKFMRVFPTLKSLSEASINDVLHLWAGLGYYSRARNLHHAAKKMMSEFNGNLPKDIKALTSLPGIGPSTAGAITAIAFQLKATILDGNVKRVLARIHGITQPINEKKTEALLWQLAIKYTPKNRIADYTQAIMDLGATLCTRRQPLCTSCPYLKFCITYNQQLTEIIPTKKANKKLPVKSANFLFIMTNQTCFLEKRPLKGIWGGLWSVPEWSANIEDETLQTYLKSIFQVSAKNIQRLNTIKHTFTHYHLNIQPIVIHLKNKPRKKLDPNTQIWYNPNMPATIGLPKPISDFMRSLT